MSQTLFENVITNLKNLRKEIASIPELQKSEKDIDEIIENIKSPLLIMVMGEFSTGKSTFINALVGQSIAKVDAKPTTAVITKLSYGIEDRITVHFRDDSIQNYDTDSFAQLTAEGDDAANELHDGIAYVERELPIDILKSMSIIDSPGLNSIKAVHEETTRRFMDKADTVLWLFDANKPGSQTEIDALKRLNPRLEPICIVNKIDAVDEDDGDSPEKIMEDIGRKLSNNKLEYQKIIGISAKMAFQGKQKNNEKLIAESNIDEFYDTVDTVVLPNRDRYKRNSMFDGLAKVVFQIGNLIDNRRKKNNNLSDSNYSAYVEHERIFSNVFDYLDALIEVSADRLQELSSASKRDSFFLHNILSFFNVKSSQKQRLSSKLTPAEMAFYGTLYWLGIKVVKDDVTAQEYLEKAAIKNDTIAQYILAIVYFQSGKMEKGAYWAGQLLEYEDESVLHNAESMFLVAMAYEKGAGIQQNVEKAMEWYEKAANAGSCEAMCYLAVLNCGNYDIENDYAEALRWINQAIDKGCEWATEEKQKVEAIVEAQLERGDHYYTSTSMRNKADKAEAIKWYLKAAEAGNSNAMLRLSDPLLTKKSKATEWLYKAVEAGNPRAMCILGNKLRERENAIRSGLSLENLLGMPKDSKDNAEAVKWYLKAAEAGDSEAMYQLGWVSCDAMETDRWFQKAIEAGASIYELDAMGRYYTRNNAEKAIKCFSMAADAGSIDALWHIGYLYEYGEGVIRKDYQKAILWYKRAADAGHKDAAWHLERLKNQV